MNTKKFYKEAMEYLKESRKYVYVATGLFFVSSIFGFIFSENLGFLDAVIAQLLEQTRDLNTVQLMVFIFQNNLMSALSAVILGIFLGIFPVINAILNGAVLGYVAAKVVPIAGVFSLWRLLPHGIFELPAIFIAIGIGMKLGTVFFVKRKKLKKEISYRIDRTFKVIVYILLPLLIIAAIIEGILIGLAI